MHMHQLRLPGEITGQINHRLAKENKALGIIGIINAALLVNALAVEELLLLDEINSELLVLAGPDAALDSAETEWQIQVPIKWMQIRETFGNAAIERCDQPYLMAGPRQELGQGADHIGQPAGLGVRDGLAARQQYFHYGWAGIRSLLKKGRNGSGMRTPPSGC